MNIRTANQTKRVASDLSDQDRTFRRRKLAQAVRFCVLGLIPASIALSAAPVGKARAALPLPGGAWTATAAGHYRLGNTTAVVNGQVMDIQQKDAKVILPWDGFDIGAQNQVEFHQPDSNSVALNRIDSADPSQILGALKANGQVFLINRNGFVFGKDATVDVNSLVVSTLPVSDDVFQKGITKVFSQGGRAAFEGSGEIYLRNADGSFALDADGQRRKISVDIQQGAKIQSARGGRVLILAPKVQNAGEIRAIDGQIILTAATDKGYLAEDASTGGLLVEVKTGGEVDNLGQLLSGHGNSTLMGFAVNQSGTISATTSALVNGSVRLIAREGVSDSVPRGANGEFLLQPTRTTRSTDQAAALDDGLGTSGRVRFGQGSRTEILPDRAAGGAAVDEQNQPQSRVDVLAGSVVMEPEATIKATSGRVDIVATSNLAVPVGVTQTASRIYMAPGSRIDVSGIRAVPRAMESNVVTVDLRTYDLRDAPLQKKGVLNGQKVRVDIRTGSPIFDVSTTVAGIKHSVQERMTAGGQVSLQSEGDVVIADGARIDASGGSLKFSPGTIDTTQLIGKADGRLYDIGSADPDMIFRDVAGELTKHYSKWGVTRTWRIPGRSAGARFEPGYVEGRDGGDITIRSHGARLDGDLLTGTVRGRLQRRPADWPRPGGLTLDLSGVALQGLSLGGQGAGPRLGERDPLPRVDDQAGNPLQPVTLPLDYFTRNGIGRLKVTLDGTVDLPSGQRLSLPVGGSYVFDANGVTIAGEIDAPAGGVSIKTHGDNAPITLGEASTIDVSGRWVNEDSSLYRRADYPALAIDGGHIDLQARGDLLIRDGFRLVANGGGWVRPDGVLVAGDGGDISLAARPGLHDGVTRASELSFFRPGLAHKVNARSSAILDAGLSARVLMGGTGQGRGGKLTLESNGIHFLAEAAGPATTGDGTLFSELELLPSLMSGRGFQAYAFTADYGRVVVDAGVSMHPRQQVMRPSARLLSAADGADVMDLSIAATLPDFLRKPLSLTLSRTDIDGISSVSGAISLGAGSHIALDARSTFAAHADSSLFVNGGISVPGGRIELGIDLPGPQAEKGYLPGQGIWVGSQAALSVAGVFVSRPDPLALRQGTVLDGGVIDVRARRGYIVMDPGARFDVSGASTVLDMIQQEGSSAGEYAPAHLASAAGSINLLSAEGMFLSGTMTGRQGGPGAAGGSLDLTIDRVLRNEPTDGTSNFLNDRTSIRPQWHLALPPEVSGMTPGAAVPDALNGIAMLDLSMLARGGFADLRMATVSGNGSEIRFSDTGRLALSGAITLDTPQISWAPNAGAAADGLARLDAAYVALGSSTLRSGTGVGTASATAQGGFLAAADLIDLRGALGFDGFSDVALSASGDIRFSGIRIDLFRDRQYSGSLSQPGRLLLAARRAYATTLADYHLSAGTLATAYPEGVDQVASGLFGSRAPALTAALAAHAGLDLGVVLSAASNLSFTADDIHLGADLSAPLGRLTLTVNQASQGSMVVDSGARISTAATDAVTPLGQTQAGLDWLYPLTGGGGNLVFSPERTRFSNRIEINADRITLDPGATVDVSAAGDLQAWEFIPGPGGSRDGLASGDGVDQFAIMPGLGRYAPLDPNETAASTLQVGDAIHLAGMPGLPSGDYALLPSHYALLDGAFLVTPVKGTGDMLVGEPRRRLDGAPVIAGFRLTTGTGFQDARWSGFAIETPGRVKTRAEYLLSRANTFFPKQAGRTGAAMPVLPRDAGSLTVNAGQALALGATISAGRRANGRGGRLDILADRLAVVSRVGQAAPGEVALLASDIDRADVESILLGAARRSTSAGTELAIRSARVRISPDAGQRIDLTAPELMIAARDQIEIDSGVTITAQGMASRPGDALLVAGDGALVQVSAARARPLKVTGQSGATGSIHVAAGATLAASGAMTLAASRDNVLDGQVDMTGGSLFLGAQRISLGSVPAGQDGLVLDGARLASLQPDELTLASRGTTDLYGSLNLTGKTIRIFGGGLVGHGQASDRATLTAASLEIANPDGRPVPAAGVPVNGMALDLRAGTMVLGSGYDALSGYGRVNITAGTLLGRQQGGVRVDSDLTIDTRLIAGESGATTAIDASGHAMTLATTGRAGGAIDSASASGLGADWTLIADRIEGSSHATLPSGNLTLLADAGPLRLDADTRIDLSGSWRSFADQRVAAPAGGLTLRAASGDLILDPGLSIDLSSPGESGILTLFSAGSRVVTLPSRLDAHGGTRGGRFALTSERLGQEGFDGLAGVLANAGFNESVRLHVRGGDLALGAGQVLTAHTVDISTDTGNIDLAGRIDASGPRGGGVALAAGDRIDVTGVIDAHATGSGQASKGGGISLTAIDADGDNIAGIGLDGTLDVSAGDGGTPGRIDILARRQNDRDTNTANDEVDLTPGAKAEIKGVSSANVYGVRVYAENQPDGLRVDGAYVSQLKSDTQRYMAQSAGAADRLGAGFSLMPGIELRNQGDIRLTTAWDLASQTGGSPDWRFGTDRLPGMLTMRAAGNLRLDRDLSDGFGDIDLPIVPFPLTDQLLTDASWSYSLTAGGDLTAANPLVAASQGNQGDLVLDSAVTVRTGTGNIAFAAARDFVLTDSTSAIYSAGHATAIDRWGGLDALTVLTKLSADFPVQGGDISIDAGRNIIGSRSRQFMREWLYSMGTWTRASDHAGELPVAWGPHLVRGLRNPFASASPFTFEQNIASLGGGDITIAAGGELRDLSVMLPSNGKPLGKTAPDHSAVKPSFLSNDVLVQGGGTLRIDAGGDILGGVFYDGMGRAEIRSAGRIREDQRPVVADRMGPLLALGDSQFSLQARTGVTLNGVVDPLILPASAGSSTFFFGYGADSAVTATSLAGDVLLKNDVATLQSNIDLRFPIGADTALKVYPPSLSVQALSGSLLVERSLTLFPDRQGQLRLLAQGDITTATVPTHNEVVVAQSDADQAILPSLGLPANNLGEVATRLDPFSFLDPRGHAQDPVHRGDGAANHIVAVDGDIHGTDNLSFMVAKQTAINAGQDLIDASLLAQNNNVADVSSVVAGRDIRFTTRRNINGAISSLTSDYQVSGPGALTVQAGRDIDLGSSVGIESLGNTLNTFLPDRGARIRVIAGVNGGEGYAALQARYLKQSDDYLDALKAYLRDGTIDLSQVGKRPSGAVSDKPDILLGFAGLTATRQQRFLDRVFFNELRRAGILAAKTSGAKQTAAYDQGRLAVQTRFPNPSGGDLSLLFSKIQTLDGGGIDLMVPRGLVNAGVASAGGLSKAAKDLGIVTQTGGDVSAYVSGDFLVNQSRVFAMGGGDILIWSNEGNIDAGRGALSALSAPPPKVSFDKEGNLIVEFPPAVTGSGIRTFSTQTAPAGDVFLFAPSGVINAGEAGIAGNNVTLAATQVIGADRIEVGGIGAGVPAPKVGGVSASVSSASTVASSSSKSAEDVGSVGGGVDEAPLTDSIPGFVIVELLGFGAEQ